MMVSKAPPIRDSFIPFYRAYLDDAEKAEVMDSLDSGWLTTGPKTKQFEADFAAYTGRAHAVAMNSCTAALHVSMVAAGIKEGDEIITPSMTFPSAVNEMVHERIKPVLIDIEPDTLNMDVDLVEPLITERTRAVIPIHFSGHPVEQDRLRALADKHNLLVLGDAAHATESRFRGKHVSEWEDATSYSFYATKNLSTGEGGMLTTNHDELADKARLLSLHGMSRDAWKRYTESGYKHWDIVTPGYKYNMPDLMGALGLHQLRKLPGFTVKRKELTEYYNAAFADLADYLAPLQVRNHVESAYHLYVLQIKSENLTIDRDGMLDAYQKHKIGIGVHFRALHLHPWYQENMGYRRGMYPNTEYASDRVVSLPLFTALSRADQDYIIDVTRHLILSHRK
jgi:dTDP-4-amino-4,6-dideoxygalactose transaminase